MNENKFTPEAIAKEPVVVPIEFDPETKTLLEALAGDDDNDNVVSLRSIMRGGDGKDDAPGGDDHIDPEDDVETQDEDERSSSPADWATVSTRQARQFIHDHPEAAIDIVFPTVYEEDRSAKLKDLGTAQGLGAISHQRMSEMMAKELGVDPYKYDEEQQQIEDENPPIDPAKDLGSGDKIMQQMLGPLGGTQPTAGPGGGGFPKASPDMGGGFPGSDTGSAGIGKSSPGTASERPLVQSKIVGTGSTDEPRMRRGEDDIRGNLRQSERDRAQSEMRSRRATEAWSDAARAAAAIARQHGYEQAAKVGHVTTFAKPEYDSPAGDHVVMIHDDGTWKHAQFNSASEMTGQTPQALDNHLSIVHSPMMRPGSGGKFFRNIPKTKQSSESEGGPGSGRHPEGFKIPSKDPAVMSGAEINKEMDKHDARNSELTRQLIDAGHGQVKHSDLRNLDHPAAQEYIARSDRQMDLRSEISRRYGPGAPSRLPKGFGPIKGAEAEQDPGQPSGSPDTLMGGPPDAVDTLAEAVARVEQGLKDHKAALERKLTEVKSARARKLTETRLDEVNATLARIVEAMAKPAPAPSIVVNTPPVNVTVEAAKPSAKKLTKDATGAITIRDVPDDPAATGGNNGS